MDRFQEMKRAGQLPSQFYGQFRWGRVSSVDADRHSAQVQFEEIDGFVSWDLAVLAGLGGDYFLPAQNTLVLCVIVDGRLGVGFVLGAFYSDNDAAPLSDASQRAVVGSDLRLGDANASKNVAIDGDESDAGTLVLNVSPPSTLTGTYTDPGGTVTPVSTGATIKLKAKISAGATKVKAK